MSVILKNVHKSYESESGVHPVLKGIDLTIQPGEFVAIIGKSGSGKSTLLNMITGIDRPTTGSVRVNDTDLHSLPPRKLAPWRGRQIGVIFQFFQLLPTLSLLENVMLPMDFCGMYAPRERLQRAMGLLEQVQMAEHAHKMPSAVSGGQQQRVAIARALANDPPIIVADEPTGSLDSKTADSVFTLFRHLVERGKTVIMVTHDNDLAHQVQRTVVVVDGEIVNEYVMQAFPHLDAEQLGHLHSRLERVFVPAGSMIIQEGDEADRAYIIVSGEADVLIHQGFGEDRVVNRLEPGQYFGEIALIHGSRRTASVRAREDMELLAFGKEELSGLLNRSTMTVEEMNQEVRERLAQLATMKQAVMK
ncbi:ATP-binding cassette domain-containing protein [Brevibacillus choshinensis]|uniref:ATP-binding cassette domain-containing protein n=1 Tax=Brevibacillus choshinensis TaxID=54911 RepID=A0ABX7FR75_BRECH|nr:ATP-binding cassette domain-containing protein [Brevibacillus choshinensis]QRG68310.1 ATP-binding cassette domain-containing protein [Brevibacillus choshinensis]